MNTQTSLVIIALLGLATLHAQTPPTPAAPSAAAAPASKPVYVPLVPPLLADYAGAPFGGKAQRIPGRVELENYDEGGHGVAYYDRTPETNSANGYRLGEGVDVKGMILPPGRKPWVKSNRETPTVGWMFAGEWMHYTLDVTPGVYDVTIAYGTPIDGKRVDIHLNGEKIASVATPSTGEYTKWATATVRGVKVSASGRALLRVEAAGKDLDENDLDWVEFTPAAKP